MLLASNGNNDKQYSIRDIGAMEDPYPVYKEMQEACPVYYSSADRCWLLTRYKDVYKVFLNKKVSMDPRKISPPKLGSLGESVVGNYMRLVADTAALSAQPEHTRMRRILSQLFTPDALSKWESIVESEVDKRLKKVLPLGKMDMVADIAATLPSTVIARILGLPEDKWEQFRRWAQDITFLFGNPIGNIEDHAAKANRAAAEIMACFEGLIKEREANATSDVLSQLIESAEREGVKRSELIANFCLLVFTGRENVTNMIPIGVYHLLKHPDQWQMLKQQPDLVHNAIEEILRYDVSNHFVYRYALEDLEFEDARVPAGHVLALGVAAANRDPDVFDKPDVFDITRTKNRHQSFGFGIHACVGKELARMQLKAVLEGLTMCMPNLKLDESRPPKAKRESIKYKSFYNMSVQF